MTRMTGESKGGWDRVNTERKNNLTYPAASHGSDRPVHVMYPQPETLVDPCLIRDDQLPRVIVMIRRVQEECSKDGVVGMLVRGRCASGKATRRAFMTRQARRHCSGCPSATRESTHFFILSTRVLEYANQCIPILQFGSASGKHQ